ncbi:MAG: ATP-binding protein [Gallionella sp.]|nr:ATP-binding protein [Gallionella sp.]
MNDQSNKPFTFNISLSVLNHLGRNLYRNFITVLGEAISNAWDADANNVWIYIDRENHSFVIKDDGIGMSGTDFQNKFLKIGYSKRKGGASTSKKGRPFIGRKGIGKLALLSCASKISVISKKKTTSYVGGIIANAELDKAITNDLEAHDYLLKQPKLSVFGTYTEGHNTGTIIRFDGIHGGITNTVDYLKKIIALYFRFSLVDKKFNIFLNGDKITLEHLKSLADETQFLWDLNDIVDPYVNKQLTELDESRTFNFQPESIKGFIASVKKPSGLKIKSTDEKVSVDLFVNGRLREKDILKHIPTARIVESYLYGQIHFNELDGIKDSFTSSREGIVADDPNFRKLLNILKTNIIPNIISDWDEWRLKHNQDGDPDNLRMNKKERKSRELYTAVTEAFTFDKGSKNKTKVDRWVNELSGDAQYNFGSYAECFISENLIRKYIEEKTLPPSLEAAKIIAEMRDREQKSKDKGNVSIEIRELDSDLSYLSMTDLANLVDKKALGQGQACLPKDALEYKPMRDAVAHTALLTNAAKLKLTSVYENIKGRVIKILQHD